MAIRFHYWQFELSKNARDYAKADVYFVWRETSLGVEYYVMDYGPGVVDPQGRPVHDIRGILSGISYGTGDNLDRGNALSQVFGFESRMLRVLSVNAGIVHKVEKRPGKFVPNYYGAKPEELKAAVNPENRSLSQLGITSDVSGIIMHGFLPLQEEKVEQRGMRFSRFSKNDVLGTIQKKGIRDRTARVAAANNDQGIGEEIDLAGKARGLVRATIELKGQPAAQVAMPTVWFAENELQKFNGGAVARVDETQELVGALERGNEKALKHEILEFWFRTPAGQTFLSALGIYQPKGKETRQYRKKLHDLADKMMGNVKIIPIEADKEEEPLNIKLVLWVAVVIWQMRTGGSLWI